jgi:hypothetical protein
MCNEEKRSEYSHKFSNYLISMCWPKMYRQIKSWQGLGFVYLLHCFGKSPEIRTAIALFRDWNAPYMRRWNHGDKSLVAFLKINGEIKLWLDQALPAELASFQPAFDAIMNAPDNQPFYTWETAKAFHSLVVAAFISFGKLLCDLQGQFSDFKQAVSAAKDDEKDLLLLYLNHVKAQVLLLLYLLSSSAFKIHIYMCTNAGTYTPRLTPIYEEWDQFLSFGREHRIVPEPQAIDPEPGFKPGRRFWSGVEHNKSKDPLYFMDFLQVCKASHRSCKHDTKFSYSVRCPLQSSSGST